MSLLRERHKRVWVCVYLTSTHTFWSNVDQVIDASPDDWFHVQRHKLDGSVHSIETVIQIKTNRTNQNNCLNKQEQIRFPHHFWICLKFTNRAVVVKPHIFLFFFF